MAHANKTLTDLSAERVRALFRYDTADGLLRWANDAGRGGRIPAGTVVGRLHPEGYRYVRVGARHYRVSRLIWLYMTGEWPTEQVDHKNNDTSDDSWSNLRLATPSQNKANSRVYKKKTCSLKGVQAVQKRHSIRYRAVATKDGVRHNLGNFDTELEAHLAYVRAAEGLYGEFANDGTRIH